MNIKMQITVGTRVIELTDDEARDMYSALRKLFGVQVPFIPNFPVYPAQPSIPFYPFPNSPIYTSPTTNPPNIRLPYIGDPIPPFGTTSAVNPVQGRAIC